MSQRWRSKRFRSSPTTAATRPTPARPARPPGAAGGGLSQRGDPLLGQSRLHPRRRLGHRRGPPGRGGFSQLCHRRPRQPTAVLEFGFRPGNPAVAIGDPINTANGLNPGKPDTEFATPDPRGSLRPGRQLGSKPQDGPGDHPLDVSGSMADLAGDGFSKLELAKEAVITSLDKFKPEDEIGLWVFSTNLDGDKDYLELIPPAPSRHIREELESTISAPSRRRYGSLRLDHGRGSGREGRLRQDQDQCGSAPDRRDVR